MSINFEKQKGSDEWYTPKWIVERLGHFDLDPCEAVKPLCKLADMSYTIEDDGLSKEWKGRVFMNPPYRKPLLNKFIDKLIQHGNGIALIFNRMDTALWHDKIFPTADAMLILRGRIKFFNPAGEEGLSAGTGSVLVAWGEDNVKALYNSGIDGKFIKLN